MTQAGNATYRGPDALPPVVPLFPLPGALLLPRGQLPLNIFEPRYLAMVEDAMRGDRLIGMIQPRFDRGAVDLDGRPPLVETGGLGRITQYAETGDGRIVLTLTGVSRFRIVEEMSTTTPYRIARITAAPFASDFTPGFGQEAVDRKAVMTAFKAFLEANDLEADWNSFNGADNEPIVNSLAMMSPYGAAEKQALLEAEDLKTRGDILVAITERMLAGRASPHGPLQ